MHKLKLSKNFSASQDIKVTYWEPDEQLKPLCDKTNQWICDKLGEMDKQKEAYIASQRPFFSFDNPMFVVMLVVGGLIALCFAGYFLTAWVCRILKHFKGSAEGKKAECNDIMAEKMQYDPASQEALDMMNLDPTDYKIKAKLACETV